MDITRIRALRGPNVWSRNTALEVIIQLDASEASLAEHPALAQRLYALVPSLPTSTPAPSLARVLADVTLHLQILAGCPVRLSHERATTTPGVTRVVIEYSQESVGRRALELAQSLIQSLGSSTPFDLPAAIRSLRELDEDIRLGPSTGAIVQAAQLRGIPFRRLTQGSLVQLGWGVHQRRIQAAEVDTTSAIAEAIAQDKDLTKQLLEKMGVPVPSGQSVTDLDHAWSVLQILGGPAVVKPRDGSQGRGVAVNVQTRAELVAAWEAARTIGDEIIVERYIPGDDYRLLIIDGQLAAAARRDPPYVIGDGQRTVAELVDALNQDPRRGDGHATSLTKIKFDAITHARLSTQGLSAEAVPATGVKVTLRNNANLSTGGSATDVTDDVHPAVAARAIEAARMVGLHICGVDIVCQTVTRPLEEQGGGIVEVNAAPGLRMHLSPSYGQARPIGAAIVNMLYGPGQDGRIPTVGVTGTNGKTTTVRLIAALLSQSGLKVGMTLTDGVIVNGVTIDQGDCSGPKSARSVLMHPDAEAAVFEVARGGLLREGLGVDRLDVGVVTNIGMGDHLGMNYIDTVEDIAWVKGVVIENVANTGMAVLNAEDPLCVALAGRCVGSVTFFAHDEHHPVLVAHRARHHRVVFRRGGHLVAAHREVEWSLPWAEIPLTHGGAIAFQVANVMAAVAAVWALDLPWPVIQQGLAHFASTTQTVPGRFNLFSWRGATLVADYGHNPDAMQALVQAIAAMPAKRRMVVISGAGDRRDADLRSQTEILGHAFDEVILYQDAAQRGRADGEVIALLRAGLDNAPRTRHITSVHGEFLAIDMALERLTPGDVCLILVDQVQEALNHLQGRIAQP